MQHVICDRATNTGSVILICIINYILHYSDMRETLSYKVAHMMDLIDIMEK